MNDRHTNSTERARRILDAWERMELSEIQAELVLAESDGARTGDTSSEEHERLDLLGGIAGQLRQDFSRVPRVAEAGERTALCFRLLQHLAETGEHASIRSEKLSFFPCSQSARRISACH
ncbi:MAG TPA: hypothetical protein VNH83_09105 [Bryobacteraceae bacterium]|nr:hypothetical protein [Bryobacteraceae bacterium]